MRHLLALLLSSAAAIAGCSPAAAPAATPSAVPLPTTSASPTPGPTMSPLPTPGRTLPPTLPPGTTAWPLVFSIEMRGTYWSSPPFAIPFSITIDEPGWFSGHLNAEFVDVQRFDGMAQRQFPNRMLGFADPGHVRGNDGDVDVEGLTPDAALDLLADRASLTSGNRAQVEMFDLVGARLDLHSATDNNPLFGGADGNFGLGPQLDVRLVLLPLDGGLFVVAVLAAPGDLDAAWEQALEILQTVALGD